MKINYIWIKYKVEEKARMARGNKVSNTWEIKWRNKFSLNSKLVSGFFFPATINILLCGCCLTFSSQNIEHISPPSSWKCCLSIYQRTWSKQIAIEKNSKKNNIVFNSWPIPMGQLENEQNVLLLIIEIK